MRHVSKSLSAVILLVAASHCAMAAPSPEEAKRLTDVFQAYVGAKPGMVTVTPDGDGYKVNIDLKAAMGTIDKSQGSFEMSPFEFTLKDLTGGKWQVDRQGPLELKANVPNSLNLAVKTDNYVLTGVFDEALGTFSKASSKATALNMVEDVVDPTKGKVSIIYDLKDFVSEQTSSAAADGSVDSVIKSSNAAVVENIVIPADGAQGTPAMAFTVTTDKGETNITLNGMKAKPINALWAFVVANAGKDAMIKAQTDLKVKVTDALPLFTKLASTSTLQNVKVATMMGEFKSDTVGVALDVNGLVKDGLLREKISLGGLAVPAGMVPPWASSLVPKSMTFDFAAQGFDLDAPTQLILKSLDLSKDPPLPAGFESTLLPALIPKGTVTLKLNPTEISNDNYAITAEGTFDAGPSAMPTGKAHVTAKGLDTLMQAIQAAPPEMGLQSGSAVIVVAKGLAKTNADGSLSWDVESVGGQTLVNGQDINKLK